GVSCMYSACISLILFVCHLNYYSSFQLQFFTVFLTNKIVVFHKNKLSRMISKNDIIKNNEALRRKE
ncbi:MAG: hypothetical protein ACJ71E_06390, partial [Nitrososphaeraceae archaeon]